MRTLVLGGIRSGKSRWAETAISAALDAGRPVRYLATGPTPGTDTAWSHRVAEHRARRPGHWHTVETTDVTAALRGSPQLPTLVDDVGGWLTAMLDRHGWDTASADASDTPAGPDTPVAAETDALIAAVTDFSAPLTLVSPEVGLSVIPATASGRRFADLLGSLNQRLADCCDAVVLVVAGQAVGIKPSTGSVGIG